MGRYAFGLFNAPATFLRMMNDILRDFLHKFATTVYLDDVCIYSRALEEHMRLVLQRFKEEGLSYVLRCASSAFKRWNILATLVSIGKILVSTKKVEAVTY
jgi:hypothetical protein